MGTTFTWATLRPAQKRTFYFIGVTTGQSSIRKVFPLWARHLHLGDVDFAGIDMPLHAPAEQYRAVVQFLKDDPLSLGALVTTHKIDLFRSALDLFDEADPLASLMGEVSCISKRGSRLRAHAKDPISSGLALDMLVPRHHFASHQSDVLIFGAGGSAVAIDWYLTRPDRRSDRPARVIVTNRSTPRLDTLRAAHERSGATTELETVLASDPNVNDTTLASVRPGSLVINATGLGKDAPGSPITDTALFPRDALVWELNYRGDLVFLRQARAQSHSRGVRPTDGWVYFIHGWTQVIGEVFDVEIPTEGPEFDVLSRLAASVR